MRAQGNISPLSSVSKNQSPELFSGTMVSFDPSLWVFLFPVDSRVTTQLIMKARAGYSLEAQAGDDSSQLPQRSSKVGSLMALPCTAKNKRRPPVEVSSCVVQQILVVASKHGLVDVVKASVKSFLALGSCSAAATRGSTKG